MKKIFKTLLITLLTLMSFTNTIFALDKTATITSLEGYENKVEVAGTMSGECTAVAILVYDGDNCIAMETKPVNNMSFSASVGIDLTIGRTYTLKVADFDGGTFTTQNFVVKQSGGGSRRYVVPNTGVK